MAVSFRKCIWVVFLVKTLIFAKEAKFGEVIVVSLFFLVGLSSSSEIANCCKWAGVEAYIKGGI